VTSPVKRFPWTGRVAGPTCPRKHPADARKDRARGCPTTLANDTGPLYRAAYAVRITLGGGPRSAPEPVLAGLRRPDALGSRRFIFPSGESTNILTISTVLPPFRGNHTLHWVRG